MTKAIRPEAVPVPAMAWRPVLCWAGGLAAILTLVSGRIGLFGDELYFVVAGRTPDWGYVDQPPLVPLLAAALDRLGHQQIALRVPATLAAAAMVVLTAMTARELGAGRRAQILASVAAVTSLGVFTAGRTLSTSIVDPALWALLLWLVVRWVRTSQDRLLLLAGLVTAVAIQGKFLVVTLWAVLIVAVLVAGPRRMLTRPALWAGGAVTVLSALPGLIWQVRHGLPQLSMAAVVAAEQQESAGGRLTFLPLVLAAAGVGAGAVLSGYGIWRLLSAADLRPYRFLGLTAAGVLLVFLVSGGRQTYAYGLLPLCWAAGAAAAPPVRGRRLWRWATGPVSLACAALVTTFAAVPVRPMAQQVRIDPITRGSVGWPGLVDTAAAAYRAMSAPGAVIVAETYWQAGALNVYGPDRGLPRAYSYNRGLAELGRPSDDASTTTMYVGVDPGPLGAEHRSTRRIAHYDNPLGFPGMNAGVTVWEMTGRAAPWSVLWPQLRHDDTNPLILGGG